MALLRSFQPEARALVRTALDVLTPVLRKRLPPGGAWVKWTKKILVEEGHSAPQLIHILNLILRHPVLFYPSRDQFSQQIVNALQKLGLQPNASLENRKLALDLIDLLLFWYAM